MPSILSFQLTHTILVEIVAIFSRVDSDRIMNLIENTWNSYQFPVIINSSETLRCLDDAYSHIIKIDFKIKAKQSEVGY